MGSRGAPLRTEYDDCGRITTRIDPNGATTRYEYDEEGNRNRIIDALGHECALTYNHSHQPLVLVDPEGHAWKRHYDDLNRLVVNEDPLGARRSITYDGDGNPVTVTGPTGGRRRQVYSPNGLLLETTDWMGNPTRYAYDPFGRVVERIGPSSSVVRFRYDLMGDPLVITLADGSQIQCEYDGSGNLTQLTNGKSYTITCRYGPCGRLLEYVDRTGGIVRYQWGSEPGRLETITNQNGEVYSLTYNQLGRVVSEESFDGRRLQFRYDAAGHCVAIVNGNRETVTLTRDLMGRLTEQLLPDATAVTFQYDAIGNPVAAATRDAEVRFVRDPARRLVRQSQDSDFVETQFDAAGYVIGTTTSLGQQIDYLPDANGRLTRVTIQDQSISFARNARGQEVSRFLPGKMRLDQEYDLVGRLVEQRFGPGGLISGQLAEIPAASALIRRAYTYDRGGALTSVEEGQWTDAEYVYDPADRLLDAVRGMGGSERFSYDAAGNVTRAATDESEELFRYGLGGRLLQRGQTLYYYDDNGRLVKKVEPSDGSRSMEWHYEWDALDQLRSVRTPDSELWEYGYDAFGRRVFKHGPGGRQRFIWDRNVVINEIAQNGLQTAWIFDHNTFVPLGKVQRGELYCVIPDHLGTPRELVDRRGEIVWAANFSVWGRARKQPAGAIDCPIRFPGQWFDSETGLHYNRFRYYEAEAGRFISPDPIRLYGGLNAYIYTRNPINWTDPFGLKEGCGDEDGDPDKKPARLPRDENVDPEPPDPLPLDRPVGKNANQNQMVQDDIDAAQAAGGRDFRVNQQQVNADEERVGLNRPDLQYTDANGNRIYIEYDTSSSGRGPGHQQRINSNDPGAPPAILKIVD
jgi:RHS repeat-associated protein